MTTKCPVEYRMQCVDAPHKEHFMVGGEPCSKMQVRSKIRDHMATLDDITKNVLVVEIKAENGWCDLGFSVTDTTSMSSIRPNFR